MANKRIKDITTASTSFASDDFVITDSATSGTRKMTKDNLISQVSAGVSGDYLEESNNLSDVASKDTAKLNLEIPNVGTAANQVPLNGMLNSGAYLDFDAFYETGTWSPSITFGNGSTGVLYSEREGYFTRIGDTVFVSGVCTISAVGGSNGTARITGLPFVSRNMASTSFTVSSVAAFDMTGLTSAITALIEDNQPNAILYDGGATGSTAIDHSNFTGTSSIRFSATYQIA